MQNLPTSGHHNYFHLAGERIYSIRKTVVLKTIQAS